MRGRLISNYVVELAQLDTQLSAQTSPGYDDVFQEPAVTVDPVTHQRVTGRKERVVRIPAQVGVNTLGQLVMLANGAAPKTSLQVVFHYADFEDLGMLDDARRTTPVRVNDRMTGIYSVEDGVLLAAFPDPPGLYVTEARPGGFMGDRVNLLVCTLGDRMQGKPT